MIGRFQSLDGKLGSSCGFCVSPTQHYGQRSYVTIEDTDVLCGRGKTSFNHGMCVEMATAPEFTVS